MKRRIGQQAYFSKTEAIIWASSVFAIIAAYCIFDRGGGLTIIASIIGVTSIMINAKGNPIGQMLMIVFSLVYGYISFDCAYYGEMITYLGMTMPMSALALASWLAHPYSGRRSEVQINRISNTEVAVIFLLSLPVTVLFYFVLRFFGTANVIPSTASVTTSFLAAALTFRRSPYFSLAYALNDVVLIVLWSMAIPQSTTYASVVVCFAAFLVNDIYGFINWKRLEKYQMPK